MNTIPDRWCVITFKTDEGEIDKVLAGWYGGYLDSSYWKLSSGVERVEETEEAFIFHNYSGSVYTCYKNRYGLTALTSDILYNLTQASSSRVLCTNKYEDISD